MDYRPRTQRSAKRYAENKGSTTSALTRDALGFLYFQVDSDDGLSDFHTAILLGAQAEAARLGLHMVVETLPRLQPTEALPKMLREDAVAGMLLVGAAPPEVLAPLRDSGTMVLVDNQDRNNAYDVVLSDDFGGGYAATRYLIELGHRKIGFVMNEPTAPTFQARMRGYVVALFEAGIPPDPRWIICAERCLPVDTVIRPVLQNPDRPTALVAANDINAYCVMRECRAQGLRIPDDLSVVGYDNLAYSGHTTPQLTTIQIEKDYMGRLAVRRLYARVREAQDGTSCEQAVHIHVPATLVIRESCAPPKS